ncbi:Predicted dehydrogenase [Spirosomataceae bacterium TFI 002]|nr:Predicted dehydrogenase [Spirosomataceae bacterium TFI 002]
MENRRSFIKKAGLGLGAMTIAGSSFSFFEGKKLNVALVGLGRYANYMAEGIAVSKYCKVAGIVTGSPEKVPIWREKYNIPLKNCYNYDNFDSIANNPDIDVIYVILPNAMHKEYVIRAAQAGKHVIVEKPMATNAQDCLEMIEACKKAKVQLAVGYRLHFEPYNMEMMRLGQEKVFGQVKLVEASLGYNISARADADDWHFKKALSGGGPLQNLGVYCVQAARYITGEEPVSVTAQFGPVTNKELYKEVEESIYWQMEFPSGAVSTSSSTNACGIDRLFASAENGNFELSPAISYGPFVGKSSNGPFDFPQTNQQQVQMDEMAKILLNKKTFPDHISGLEGWKDMKVIDAVYKAAETGERVIL